MPVLKRVNKLPIIPLFKMRDEDRFPKKIGDIPDLYYETKQRRLEMAKVVRELEKQEKFLRQFVIDNVPKSNTTGVAGHIAKVQIIPKSTPQCKDWDKLYAFILKTRRLEMLQRRLSIEAINEYIDAGKNVPGIEIFNYKDVSLTKL